MRGTEGRDVFYTAIVVCDFNFFLSHFQHPFGKAGLKACPFLYLHGHTLYLGT